MTLIRYSLGFALRAGGLVSALLLAGCQQATLPLVQAAPDSVLTLSGVQAAGSDAELQARYGGRVALRTPTFVVLAFDQAPTNLNAQRLGAERLEPNRAVFRSTPGVSSSGSVKLWGAGSVKLWGAGSVKLWGAGFLGVSENASAWSQIKLPGITARGDGVTIAVIDTGLDFTHPAFEGSLAPASSWHDFVDGDAQPQDEGVLGLGEAGHGSEMAGIALQVAPGIKLMPLRVLDQEGQGDVLSVASAIVWATDHGAQIINLSLGAEAPVEAVTQALAYANAHGVMVAAAAGNSGQPGLDTPAAQLSGSALNVSVGSVSTAAMNVKSDFSRYAPGLDVLAPGEDILGPALQGQAASWSGTSMATPMVSAALALGLGSGWTPQHSVQVLRATAQSLDDVAGNAAYRSGLGHGLINLQAYLAAP